jgi:hypothetical protein
MAADTILRGPGGNLFFRCQPGMQHYLPGRGGRIRDCSPVWPDDEKTDSGTGTPGPYRPRIPLFRCRTGRVSEKTGMVSVSGGDFHVRK